MFRCNVTNPESDVASIGSDWYSVFWLFVCGVVAGLYSSHTPPLFGALSIIELYPSCQYILSMDNSCLVMGDIVTAAKSGISTTAGMPLCPVVFNAAILTIPCSLESLLFVFMLVISIRGGSALVIRPSASSSMTAICAPVSVDED